MKTETLDEVEVDTCATCGGLWLDEGELREMLTNAPVAPPTPARARAPRSLESAVSCPRCSAPMTRFQYGRASGVTLDKCAGDGIWFDAGGLDRVREFAASKDYRAKAAKMRAADEKEARERKGFWSSVLGIFLAAR